MRWFLGALLAVALAGCETTPSVVGIWKPDKYAGDPSTYTIRKDGTFELDGDPKSSIPSSDPLLKDIYKMSGTWKLEGDRLNVSITRAPLANVFEGMGQAIESGRNDPIPSSDEERKGAATKLNTDLDTPIKKYFIVHFRDNDTLVLTTDDYKTTTVLSRQKQAN